MAKGKSTDEMYQDLILEMGSALGTPGLRGSSYDREDEEEFFTSKEVEARRKDLEDRFGPLPTGPEVIEEEAHFKRYSSRREHKYTEKELAAIRESCKATIVHDYGDRDIYHMSDEERRQNDILNELSGQLSTLKGIYRQVDQYIKAMRIVVQAWEILEKNNYVHTKDEFYEMVADGKIVSSRIVMPKLKGIGNYNMDTIIKYISNPELDPTDLIPNNKTEKDRFYDRYTQDFTDDPEYQEIFMELYDGVFARILEEYKEAGKDIEDPEVLEEAEQKALEDTDEDTLNEMEIRRIKRLLTPEEAAYIRDHPDPQRMKVHNVKRSMIRGYDSLSVTRTKKKLSKKEQYHRDTIHQMLNKIQSNSVRSSSMPSSFMVTHGIFDVDKPVGSPFDAIYYDGSWTDEDSLWLYDLAVRDELMKQHIPGEPYMTYADRELNNFFKVLEDSGLNVLEIRQRMNQTDAAIDAERKRREEKESKKIEAAIIQRITKLNNDPKFRKTVAKAEEELNKHYEDY